MARVLNNFSCCLSLRQICFNGSSPFTFMDIFLTFLSIGSFLGDIGTDIIVIIQYYKNGHVIWMLLTSSLVCVPSLIVQIFSIRWHIIDGTISNFLWIVHVFQLGVFHRYVQLLFLGLKVREQNTHDNLKKFNQQQSDICMLRLFESFMESAPQLVLQLYIMASTDEWNPWTGVSAFASLLSLSWGIAAYNKAMRNVRPEKKHLSWWGLLFQSLWRIGMVSSRIFSMVLFAAAYGAWLILAMAVHWLSMTIWVFFQDTDFCSTWWEERLYNCVVGIIYCFCYFNIKEGPSRFHMSAYYILVICQNITFLLAFYFTEKSDNGLKYFMTLLVPSGIAIGIISLLLYYRFFHPSGPMDFVDSSSSKRIKNKEALYCKDTRCDCCTLKTCRKLKDSVNELGDSDLKMVAKNNLLENFSPSKISVKSLEDTSWSGGLRKSYSLNYTWRSDELNKTSDSLYSASHKRKSLANHHRNINYHFRPVANLSLLSSSKIHCSCLVLTQNFNKNLTDISQPSNLPILSNSFPNIKSISDSDDETDNMKFNKNLTDISQSSNLPILSNSFPNIKSISDSDDETDNMKLKNESLMNYFSEVSYSRKYSFSVGCIPLLRQPEYRTIICDSHIIRINVE